MTPPTLSPPALHFMIIEFTTTCVQDAFSFWCKTDTPCHLTLHLSIEEPIIRRIPYQKRGADFELSSVTCFVEIATFDQAEPGDTYGHTFTVPLVAYDTWHYFYLTGTQGGVPMKSISQIFRVYCATPEGGIPTSDLNLEHDTWGGFCQSWNANAMRFQPDHTYSPFGVNLMLAQFDTFRRGPYRVALVQVGGNCWQEHELSADNYESKDLPIHPTMWPTFHGLAGPTVQPANTYRIVVRCLPGWERWTMGRWISDDSMQGLYFRYKQTTNPYPRGGYCSGCNFASGSGSWDYYPQNDWYFEVYKF